MISIRDLDKETLLDLLKQYDMYIQDANDDNRYADGWYPVCISEFLNCEYQEILEEREEEMEELENGITGKYIYAIWNDEEDGTAIYTTPLKYWKKEGCVDDRGAAPYIQEAIESIMDGMFDECTENCFGHGDCELVDNELIHKELAKFKDILEFNQDFQDWINQ
jgi:hypothetical protein